MEFDPNIIHAIVGLVAAVLTSSSASTFVTYILMRRKHKADAGLIEVQADKVEMSLISDQIEQAARLVEISTNLLADVQHERETLVQMNSKLRKVITSLEEEKVNLEAQLNDCKKQLNEL